MTLIEGVGDEVVQFVSVVLILLVAALAWWSTNARPDRYRTLLVMRSRSLHPVTVSIRTRPHLMMTNPHFNSSTTQPSTSSTSVANSTESEEVAAPAPPAPRDTARVIPLQEMDSIVDADMAMLDNNRLHFYRRIDAPNSVLQSTPDSTSDESESQDEPEPTSNAQMREMDSIVSAMEAEVTADCDFFTRPSETTSNLVTPANTKAKDKSKDNAATASSEPATEDNEVDRQGASGDQEASSSNINDGRPKILIKLKYLNDTQKEVEGSLDELLKDFKGRHFSSELASESRVRLIFNGRVLGDEAATLRALGLHHRAVVHCLVHPARSSAQRGTPEEAPLNATHELITEGAQPERAWDLENILMTLVSVALTVVWFFRCEYSNMFTASASVALFGLTVFYSVAIFGLYLSDTFHFDRRQAPAVPTPAMPTPAVPAPAAPALETN